MFPLDQKKREQANAQVNAAHSKINLFSVDPGKEQTIDTLVQFAFALWRNWHLRYIVYAPCLQPGDESRATASVLMGTGLHLNQMAHARQIY